MTLKSPNPILSHDLHDTYTTHQVLSTKGPIISRVVFLRSHFSNGLLKNIQIHLTQKSVLRKFIKNPPFSLFKNIEYIILLVVFILQYHRKLFFLLTVGNTGLNYEISMHIYNVLIIFTCFSFLLYSVFSSCMNVIVSFIISCSEKSQILKRSDDL